MGHYKDISREEQYKRSCHYCHLVENCLICFDCYRDYASLGVLKGNRTINQIRWIQSAVYREEVRRLRLLIK